MAMDYGYSRQEEERRFYEAQERELHRRMEAQEREAMARMQAMSMNSLNPSANYGAQLTAQKPQPLPAKKSKVVLLCK